MKELTRIFLSGLAAIVPLALTVALLVWLGVKSEQLLSISCCPMRSSFRASGSCWGSRWSSAWA